MRPPYAAQAEIPEAKITRYLLSREHPRGRSKAAFFVAHGFDPARPRQLADALRAHALENEAAAGEVTEFGTRYRVEGSMAAPDGSALAVRSVWFIGTGEKVLRFVTAYPLKERRREP
jgi:hypothetical protein